MHYETCCQYWWKHRMVPALNSNALLQLVFAPPLHYASDYTKLRVVSLFLVKKQVGGQLYTFASNHH
jgi:hypothetical protein